MISIKLDLVLDHEKGAETGECEDDELMEGRPV